MHVYLMTRGIKGDVDRWITELGSRYLPTKWRKKEKGKWKNYDCHVQTAVRPIQLWEVVFPQQHKDLMLNTIFGEERGHTQHKKHSKFITMIRKVLGVQKIPEDYDLTKKIALFDSNNIEKVGIGIKDDRFEGEVEML